MSVFRRLSVACGLFVCMSAAVLLAAPPRPTKAEITKAERELVKLGARFVNDKKVAEKLIAIAVPYETTDDKLAPMMKHLQKLPDLETIDFAETTALSDGAFRVLGKLAAVRAIYMDHTSITGKGFSDLKEMPRLQLLSLRQCPRLDLEQFGQLKDVKTLVALDVSYDGLTQPALKQIAEACPRLQVLRANGNRFTCKDEEFADLFNMRELELSGNFLGESALQSLARFSGLTRLDISGRSEGDGVRFHYPQGSDGLIDTFGTVYGGVGHLHRNDAEQIRNSRYARGYYKPLKIGLDPMRRTADSLTLETIEPKYHWGALRSLDAAHQPISEEGFSRLARLPILEYVDVSGAPVLGEFTPAVVHWKSTKTIVAGHTRITDEGLKQTLKAPVLERLEVYGIPATFETEWANAKKLKQIVAMHSSITDKGLESMSFAPVIEEIDAPSTGLTCENLMLYRFRKLKTLNLNNTQTTDVGLRSLYTLKALRDLYLHDSQVTEKGVNAIRIALPNCRVHWDPPLRPMGTGIVERPNRPVRAAANLPQLPTPTVPVKAPPPTPRNPTGVAAPVGSSGGGKKP